MILFPGPTEWKQQYRKGVRRGRQKVQREGRRAGEPEKRTGGKTGQEAVASRPKHLRVWKSAAFGSRAVF